MKIIIGVETEPRMQFTIDADPNHMPDIICLKDGQKLIKVGAYASPGYNFSYRHINETLNYDGEVKDWIRYSKLTG